MLHRWSEAPTSVKAWIILSGAMVGTIALPGLPDFDGSPLSALALVALSWVLLLRRSAVVWWLVVLWSGFALAMVVLGQPAGDAPSVGVVAFTLLLAASFAALVMRPTRRWVRREVDGGPTSS
jgi:hypothetical protein